MEISINKLLSMQRALATRKNDLKNLVEELSTKTIYHDAKTETVPQHDIVEVDTMVTDIGKALFEIDASIKESNALTKISVDVDFNRLMSPIKPRKEESK